MQGYCNVTSVTKRNKKYPGLLRFLTKNLLKGGTTMDFYEIKETRSKKGTVTIYPDFIVGRSTDLMIRGKSFYAIWDEEQKLWSTDEYDVRRLVDKELLEYRDKLADKLQVEVQAKLMEGFSNKMWIEYRNFLGRVSDSSHQLDSKLTFQNTVVKKKDYVSKKLPYSLEQGPYVAFDEIIGTLFDPEERAKLEWAIGSVVAGEAKDIQKFIVLYGEAGAGKSTILNIIQKLFEGYYTTFEAKALTSSNNSFSTEVFRSNPLVAIQHDGDLSKIEDNTKLNSIISHEEMTMNEKYKPAYTARVNCFLFMATNQPVKITDAKSGIIRRLIDVKPSGRKVPNTKYLNLMAQIDFELGAIAYHCLEVYRQMGKNYYATYRPLDMMFKTDVFFNFVEANFHIFKEQEGITLTQAYDIYKDYCDEALVDFKLPRHKFREELKNYFANFYDVTRVDGKQIRSYYSRFLTSKFTNSMEVVPEPSYSTWLCLESTESIFDDLCANSSAQYANESETPAKKWVDVKTTLSELDTTKLHYVKVLPNHIVIDFDLRDDSGNKSTDRNMDAASKWPPTYAEYSKSGHGLHLHYIYDGDVSRLSSLYSEGIEVKVFTGLASLRRKLSKCNNIPIATINSGLPLKGVKLINAQAVKSEKALRELILRNLRKEIHPGTKPSIDFIEKILANAYSSGLKYDVTNMRPAVLAFANNSTNQASYCLKVVGQMKFQSDEPSQPELSPNEEVLVFFDVEVFPNLFLVNWKYPGKDNSCVRMINPTATDIENLFKMKLVGFNNRRYDNHILYARYLGYTNEQLFQLSAKIIGDSHNALFNEAYSVSYTDVYDFSSAANKKSLKKWEIELGLHHQELGLPWDQPVPEDKWMDVVAYCDNDVISTEEVFNHLRGDWVARQILSELSGLSPDDTTNQHAIRIIFGKDKNPQSEFVYTKLSEMFPGYKFENNTSTYRGEVTGEGGYVYAEPGVYRNVALLDVASMHPTSIEQLNLFGDKYTKKYSEIKKARIAIKRKDSQALGTLMDGMLVPFSKRADAGEFTYTDLSTALKTVLNSVYGLTFAKFNNACRDPRNIDNIVAKRGALFMIDLKYAVQEQGFTVAHVKTDSIKIPDATPEIIKFVFEFGKKYGYEFEHEATYEKMFLANDAVYIAKYATGKSAGQWTATGTQFAQPYVFKTLFSKEPIEFNDLVETKAVTSYLYLDLNEDLEDVSDIERELAERAKQAETGVARKIVRFKDFSNEQLEDMAKEGHNYHFVGKTGAFCPMKDGCGGGILLRETDGKYNSATGAKGYRWLESEVVRVLEKEDCIDREYYRKMVDTAVSDISKYTDIEWFTS
jgi:energy-coupling factor transporter ATP-binding protein EcfA2